MGEREREKDLATLAEVLQLPPGARTPEHVFAVHEMIYSNAFVSQLDQVARSTLAAGAGYREMRCRERILLSETGENPLFIILRGVLRLDKVGLQLTDGDTAGFRDATSLTSLLMANNRVLTCVSDVAVLVEVPYALCVTLWGLPRNPHANNNNSHLSSNDIRHRRSSSNFFTSPNCSRVGSLSVSPNPATTLETLGTLVGQPMAAATLVWAPTLSKTVLRAGAEKKQLAVAVEYLRAVPAISGYSRAVLHVLARQLLLVDACKGEALHAWLGASEKPKGKYSFSGSGYRNGFIGKGLGSAAVGEPGVVIFVVSGTVSLRSTQLQVTRGAEVGAQLITLGSPGHGVAEELGPQKEGLPRADGEIVALLQAGDRFPANSANHEDFAPERDASSPALGLDEQNSTSDVTRSGVNSSARTSFKGAAASAGENLNRKTRIAKRLTLAPEGLGIFDEPPAGAAGSGGGGGGGGGCSGAPPMQAAYFLSVESKTAEVLFLERAIFDVVVNTKATVRYSVREVRDILRKPPNRRTGREVRYLSRNILARHVVFEQLPPRVRDHLAARLVLDEVGQEETFVEAGQKVDALYLLLSGSAMVTPAPERKTLTAVTAVTAVTAKTVEQQQLPPQTNGETPPEIPKTPRKKMRDWSCKGVGASTALGGGKGAAAAAASVHATSPSVGVAASFTGSADRGSSARRLPATAAAAIAAAAAASAASVKDGSARAAAAVTRLEAGEIFGTQTAIGARGSPLTLTAAERCEVILVSIEALQAATAATKTGKSAAAAAAAAAADEAALAVARALAIAPGRRKDSEISVLARDMGRRGGTLAAMRLHSAPFALRWRVAAALRKVTARPFVKLQQDDASGEAAPYAIILAGSVSAHAPFVASNARGTPEASDVIDFPSEFGPLAQWDIDGASAIESWRAACVGPCVGTLWPGSVIGDFPTGRRRPGTLLTKITRQETTLAVIDIPLYKEQLRAVREQDNVHATTCRSIAERVEAQNLWHMADIGLSLLLKFVASNPVWRRLPQRHRLRLCSLMAVNRYQPGEVIAEDDDFGGTLFVCVQGCVEFYFSDPLPAMYTASNAATAAAGGATARPLTLPPRCAGLLTVGDCFGYEGLLAAAAAAAVAKTERKSRSSNNAFPRSSDGAARNSAAGGSNTADEGQMENKTVEEKLAAQSNGPPECRGSGASDGSAQAALPLPEKNVHAPRVPKGSYRVACAVDGPAICLVLPRDRYLAELARTDDAAPVADRDTVPVHMGGDSCRSVRPPKTTTITLYDGCSSHGRSNIHFAPWDDPEALRAAVLAWHASGGSPAAAAAAAAAAAGASPAFARNDGAPPETALAAMFHASEGEERDSNLFLTSLPRSAPAWAHGAGNSSQSCQDGSDAVVTVTAAPLPKPVVWRTAAARLRLRRSLEAVISALERQDKHHAEDLEQDDENGEGCASLDDVTQQRKKNKKDRVPDESELKLRRYLQTAPNPAMAEAVVGTLDKLLERQRPVPLLCRSAQRTAFAEVHRGERELRNWRLACKERRGEQAALLMSLARSLNSKQEQAEDSGHKATAEASSREPSVRAIGVGTGRNSGLKPQQPPITSLTETAFSGAPAGARSPSLQVPEQRQRLAKRPQTVTPAAAAATAVQATKPRMPASSTTSGAGSVRGGSSATQRLHAEPPMEQQQQLLPHHAESVFGGGSIGSVEASAPLPRTALLPTRPMPAPAPKREPGPILDAVAVEWAGASPSRRQRFKLKYSKDGREAAAVESVAVPPYVRRQVLLARSIDDTY